MARIESVNVGEERPFPNNVGRSGIYKTPRAAATITPLGLEGDFVSDKHHHGGPDQAVYLYFAEDYAWWRERLGRALAPGIFGENLTVSGLSSADLAAGDRFIAGAVVLEATSPRIPCGTLAKRMGDREFVKAYREAERPGVYCRVIAPGEVRPGREIVHEPYAGDRIAIVAMFRDWFIRKNLEAPRLRRVLSAPIAARVRAELEKRLAVVEAGA